MTANPDMVRLTVAFRDHCLIKPSKVAFKNVLGLNDSTTIENKQEPKTVLTISLQLLEEMKIKIAPDLIRSI